MTPKRFKYVIIDEFFPRICSEGHKHSDISKGDKVTSAGFATIDFVDDKLVVSCFGESVGLNIQSKPQHDELVLKMLFAEPY